MAKEMQLENIVPYILTFNEDANIEKCLEALHWAKEIIVVDSFSDDETLAIAARYPTVRVVQRAFDSHSEQHKFAISLIPAEKWVLRLDADWLVTADLLKDLERLDLPNSVGGIRVPFLFSIYGKITPISLYPPVIALFHRDGAGYIQDGHTERIVPSGDVINIRSHLLHEDKKSLDRFLLSQIKYSKLEAEKICGTESMSLGWKGRVRRIPGVSALLVGLYLLLIRGGLFRGRASWHYILQRVIAESIVSIRLLDDRIRIDHTVKGENE